MKRWLVALLLLAPGAASAADAAHGEKLFHRYCKGCHGPDGRGGAMTFMPHIDNLTKQGYIDLLPDEHLAQVIAHGGASVGLSSYMPAWEATLSESDIADLIAFIRTLKLH